ncbi:SDR family oxidoreductase [Gillisia hiemivivida]
MVKEIEEQDQNALAVTCDVTKEQEVEQAVKKIIAYFNRLAIAIANAGFGVGGKIESNSSVDWRRQLDVNVVGLTSTIKHSLPYLRKSGGRMVLMGSVTAMISSPQGAPLCRFEPVNRIQKEQLFRLNRTNKQLKLRHLKLRVLCFLLLFFQVGKPRL